MNKLSFKIVSTVAILICFSGAALADDDFAITLVQPGAGFLVAGEDSRVPLEIILRSEDEKKTLKRARVRAVLGQASNTKIVAKNRLLFMYSPPSSPMKTEEAIDAELIFTDGTQSTHSLGFPLAKPHAPGLSFSVSDTSIDASRPKRINLSASASSPDIQQLEFFTSHGQLEFPGAVRGGNQELFAGATFTPPLNMPSTDPSHFMVLSVATSKRGFSAQISGISTYAKVRVRAELPRGSKLVLEGTRDNPRPVTAPADGFTTSYAVIEYGQPFRAYRVQGRRKKEISVTLPRGIVPEGIAVPIPGQDIADGGTGPSILVAIPPSAFGEELYWPEIEIEGADKWKEREVSNRIHAFSFTRPKKPKILTVLADRIPIGTVEFKSSHGSRLELQSDYAQKSERGAVIASVFDPMGGPSDYPIPVARIENGRDLPVTRIDAGKFRVSLPSNTPGETDDTVRVTVELPSLNIVHGDPPELVRQDVKIPLEGPAPAIRPSDANMVTPTKAPENVGPIEPLGINLQATFSSELLFAPQLSFGGGLKVEFPLTPIYERLSILGGAEFHQFSHEGLLAFDDDETLSVTNTTASFVIPLELGFRILNTEAFNLAARVGAGIRFDSSVLDQSELRIAASATTQFAGRASLGLGYKVIDFFSVVLELGAKGIGASASDGTLHANSFDGSYTRIYLDLGVRLSI